MVACPGQDLIKVWPLPVEQPWWEDVKPAGGADEADRRLPSGDGDTAVHRDHVGGQIDILAHQGLRRPRDRRPRQHLQLQDVFLELKQFTVEVSSRAAEHLPHFL